MPRLPKRLPSGERSIVEAEFRPVARRSDPARPPSSPAEYDVPSSYSRAPRDFWDWWEIPAIMLLIPLSVFKLMSPWFRQQGMIKMILLFIGMWLFYGTFAVTLDSGAGTNDLSSSIERAEILPTIALNRCLPTDGIPTGGMPFGKLYLIGVGCAAWLGDAMFGAVGISAASEWLEDHHGQVRSDYWVEGDLGLSYLWLGLVGLVAFATVPIWLLITLLLALGRNLSVSWGS